MSIKKFYATADTTITNAYKEDLSSRATGSNMGLSDSLEVFFIYGQTPDPSALIADKLEESRILIKFDTDAIKAYYNDTFPSDVKFILKLTNAEHPYTLARNYVLKAYHLSNGFLEGNGLDMESYADEDVANWTNRTVSTPWANPGADIENATFLAEQAFDSGEENLEVDITDYVEDVFDGTADNGILVALAGTLTSGAQEQNFYTKKFFSRSSEFFFKRPVIEARKASFTGDDRGRLYKSSPLTANNEQSLYLYNTISGIRENITGDVTLELFSDSAMTVSLGAPEIATNPDTGVYKVAVTIADTVDVTTIYEKWVVAGTTTIKTGPIKLLTRTPEVNAGEVDYRVDITNMKPSYSRDEVAKFRVYTRAKDWDPTIYTVASKEIENLIIEKAYYKVVRLVDEETVIDYGIGTLGTKNEHTLLSYDALGSYFDFDMSLLERGYMYGIKLMFSIAGELKEQSEIFKFRVD